MAGTHHQEKASAGLHTVPPTACGAQVQLLAQVLLRILGLLLTQHLSDVQSKRWQT